MRRSAQRNFIIVTILVTAVIVYGSLFDFTLLPEDRLAKGGPVLYLLSTWKDPPSGRGDLVANILLYMPYGFFAALATSSRVAGWKRVAWVSLGGLILCTVMELSQFYFNGRVTNMSDVYLNTFGSLLGAIGGVLLGTEFRWPLLNDLTAKPFPALLLAAWFGYRLYPYVPTIDLHKYWNALKPVVLTPSVESFDLARYTILWMFLAYLIETVFGARKLIFAFLLVAAIEFVAKIFIIDNYLKLDELLGAIFGFALWGFVRSIPRRTAIVALTMTALVVAMRLEPFQLSATPHAFGWIPFLSFMHGSLDIDIQSFLEKFFYYGSLIWILIEGGMALGAATGFVAVLLFVTSLAETYLPGRSAELTDAAMALVIGAIYKLVPDREDRAPQNARFQTPARSARR